MKKKYPVCLVCGLPYTERKGLRFRHFGQQQAGVYWHHANPRKTAPVTKEDGENLTGPNPFRSHP